MGFATAFTHSDNDTYHTGHPFVAWNQQLARIVGVYAINLAFGRYKRLLPLLRDWSRGTVAFSDDDPKGPMLSRFRQAYAHFLHLKAWAEPWLVTSVC